MPGKEFRVVDDGKYLSGTVPIGANPRVTRRPRRVPILVIERKQQTPEIEIYLDEQKLSWQERVVIIPSHRKRITVPTELNEREATAFIAANLLRDEDLKNLLEVASLQLKTVMNPKYIINFPTKRHWRDKSRLEDIKEGLAALVTTLDNLQVNSVAIPPLGCGLGGLDWGVVKPLIVSALEQLPNMRAIIFEPSGAPQANEMQRSSTGNKMTSARATIVSLVDRYRRADLDPCPRINLLEVHKLMYFMQAAGEDLNLRYSKGHYGPYALNLKDLLNTIEGHFVSGYADGGDAPNKELSLLPNAVAAADSYLSNAPHTVQRLTRVTELIDGFETPFGLELLSTVHWVVSNEDASKTSDVIDKVYEWNTRKKQFSTRQIELAYEVLFEKGWIVLD